MKYSSNQINEKVFVDELEKLQEKQKKKLEEYFKSNKVEYQTQIIECSSRDRMEKFFQFQSNFTTREEYTSNLIECYTSSNNNYRFADAIKAAFSSPLIKSKFLMGKKDRKFFEALPKKLTIYRGMSESESESGNYGISWTLKKTIAQKFATEFIHNYDSKEQKHVVVELLINKSDALAYYGGREEDEIIFIKKQEIL
jgi:hypothetical protein